ncbi:glycoside hydrolase family 3 [Tetragenococcus osmophilus]|uniref:beta-glucosidase n=1 Tax=Tetragenococcus osmophilus TaxID=526944 RepID=A0AA38CZA8_9ENTE|nr:glycoside hydrolase family 3 N-terminal domain-containing protein [Tetragenococcus osmophilus]AYW47306.1 glycoside hydrolase family 3 [Tetragenococcus osmophilus]GMA52839.1 hypothetical protein GCM10025857_41960 [Alicyclobacillus contaminans]GMA73165.1 hypothetical protein GCM10025885_22140 [Tetragenococcus osmophilus]
MWKKRLFLFVTPLLLSACTSSEEDSSAQEESNNNYQEMSDGTTEFSIAANPGEHPNISFSPDSNIEILTEEDDEQTYYFKDLNGNGELDSFEDWRESSETRAEAFVEELSMDQIAGLMLFSSHERDQSDGLTEEQENYLENDDLRNVLHAGPNDVEDSVQWTNQMQSFVEGLGTEDEPIIPVNISSDPRSTAGESATYNSEGDISRWPSNLGMAATFSPKIVSQFANMSSQEYRALGMTEALGPQIDLASEPRWLRVEGTFGEGSQLAADLAEAYVNYSQSSFDEDGNDLGWGTDSITTQIKHFPGDGPGEGGREAHLFQGKFGVYPGDNLKEHLKVFVDGGLNLSGETEEASSVMTSYSIQTDKDGNPLIGDDYVGTAYNGDIINILRDDNNYDGKLVTDWGVTGENSEEVGYGEKFMGSGFGMEDATEEERHFEILKAGMDMFGGNNEKEPVLEAYKMWQEDYENGDLEQSAEDRFKESGERIVKSMFDLGLFEDPYVDIDDSTEAVGSKDKVDAGYKAQLNSAVMLKNKDNTIAPTDNMDEYKDQVVYIPSTMRDPHESSIGDAEPFRGPSMDVETAEKYFGEVVTDTEIKDDEGNVTGYEQPDNLDDVDLVIAGMASPDNGENFSFAGIKDDNETYYPLSLQYRPYTADGDNVRKESIAGNKEEDGSKQNRSYYGETSDIANEYDLDAVLNASELAEKADHDIPVVVAMEAKNPVIMSEFEDKVDAIVVGFGISDNALLDVILGDHEPNGLLPMQFPKDMDTVEEQFEDVPKDMKPYKDSEGNSYDFGYGLNYNGVIEDERTEKYVE